MDSRRTTTSCSALALIAVFLTLNPFATAWAQVAANPPAQPAKPAAKPVPKQPSKPTKKVPFTPFPPQVRWTLSLNTTVTAPPAYDGRFAYFPIEDDRLAAYDLDPGTLLWIAPIAATFSPAVGSGFVFSISESSLVALRQSDGSVAWQMPFKGTLAEPLVWNKDRIFSVTEGDISVFDARDGSKLLNIDIPAAPHGSLAIERERLFLPLSDGRIVAFKASGEKLWEQKIPGKPNEILAIDDQLFVGSTDNFMYALKAATGELDWHKQTGADIVPRPIADEDNIYFVSLDNELYALNRGHGVQQWMRPLPFRPAWSPVRVIDSIVVGGLSGEPKAYLVSDGKLAGEMGLGVKALLVDALHTFATRTSYGPVIVAITSTFSAATVTAVEKPVDPPLLPLARIFGLFRDIKP